MEPSSHGPAVPTKGVSRDAYNKAVELLQEKHASNETRQSLLKSMYSIDDVLETVTEAQSKYDQKTEGSKARKWLGGLSNRIMYYGQIMDVMAQHHPEYVSLAWGTMKFLFVLVLNHEETIAEVAKAVSRIADVLPRAKLQLLTFETSWMKEAAQSLYLEVISFLIRSLEWYEASPWKHAWNAFKNPYKLRFQDLRDKIDEKSRKMDEMANTLSHMKINEIHEMLVRMEGTRAVTYHLVCQARFTGLGQSIHEVQVAQILDATKHSQFPTPLESLRFCQAVRKRRVGHFDLDQATLLPRLQEWSTTSSSSLITIAGAAPTRFQTKDLATEMVDLIQNADKPVIWALKGRRAHSANELAHIDMLKQLTSQVVQLNSKRMVAHVSPNFNAPRVASAQSEGDWLEILKEGLTGLPEVYLVVDMEVLGQHSEEEGAGSRLDFFRLLEALVNGVQGGVAVKVAILSFRQDFIRSVSTESPSVSLVPLRSANVEGPGPE